MTRKVAPCTHTVVVCVERGGPLLNMGPFTLVSRSFVRESEPLSKSV